MRLNKFIASSTSLSRKEVDLQIEKKQVKVNNELARLGQIIDENNDIIEVFDQHINIWKKIENIFDASIILVHKPIFVSIKKDNTSSIRNIYELFPRQFSNFEPLYNLNSNTEGLTVLTNIRNYSLDSQSEFVIITKEEFDFVTFNERTNIQVRLCDSKFKDRFSFLKLSNYFNTYILTLETQGDIAIRKYFQNDQNKIVRLIKIKAGEFELDQLIYDKKYTAISSSVQNLKG
jgi:16S rRNA U516 pseudouridylate synthase RsuA-like enzyme